MPFPSRSTGPNGVTTPTSEWLYSVLLPKVVQWSEESQSGEVSRREPLVPLAKYCSLYGHLKEKYGPALIQVNVNTGMRQAILDYGNFKLTNQVARNTFYSHLVNGIYSWPLAPSTGIYWHACC